jgi:recombination protein RecA
MDRSKAVDLAITQIERQFGKGSIMKLGSHDRVADVPAISTGSLSLDIALGTFGVPRGRVVEIYGPESGGKTTLALHIVAEAQKKGGIAAIDAKHASMYHSQKNGTNTYEPLISQPTPASMALEIAKRCAQRRAGCAGGHSVAALVPKAELKVELAMPLGLQARLMSHACVNSPRDHKSKTTVISSTSLRMKTPCFSQPGKPPPAQRAEVYSSQRLEIRKMTSIKNGQ